MEENIYQEEYYKTIELNSFDNLPNQELIDSDKRVALAVWRNYKSDSFYYHDCYHEKDKYELDWKIILKKYETNLDFWKEANLSSELLHVDFCNLFPEISKKLLSDKDFIIKTIHRISFSREESPRLFLDILKNLMGDVSQVKKEFLLSGNTYITKEEIQELENDRDFVINVLKKNPGHYPHLNDVNKNDIEIIEIMKEKTSYSYLSVKLQRKHIDDYILINPNFTLNDIRNLDEGVQKELVIKTNNVDNLLDFYKKYGYEFKNPIINALNYNSEFNKLVFDQIINKCDENTVMNLLGDNIKDIKPQLENWINNLSINKFNKIDEKIMSFILLDNELSEKLKKSYEYKFSKIKTENKNISIELVKEYAEYLFKRVDLPKEKIANNLQAAKQLLPIDTLKELRIPSKEKLISYFLYEKLQKEINIEIKKEIKNKI